MKLIIREYLASLRERNELDALLPDLLSQMGLDVFSKPSIGPRQYGVDVAGFGSLDGGPNKVYLYSIKAGDLGRNDWNNGNPQDLKPSLDEILDVYIPTHLPIQYKDVPIEICICFGGDLKQNMQLTVAAYEEKYSTDTISFSEWGGERLANLIEENFLKEDLLPDQYRRSLRKSLAMLDEPEISYSHFRNLALQLASNDQSNTSSGTLTSIRQLHLSLWVLYAWCREADNLESAYLCSEYALLTAWESGKDAFTKRDKCSKALCSTLDSIISLHILICRTYHETSILPHVGKLHGLSHAVRPSCALDVNLKMFDILGRLATTGLWLYWQILENVENKDRYDVNLQDMDRYHDAVLLLINNNPMLHAPYKDEQAIDIALAILFLALNPVKKEELHTWLSNIVSQIEFAFRSNGSYPCHLESYQRLLEHPSKENDAYLEEVTQGSVIYPAISLAAALHEFDDVYSKVQNIKSEHLKHCNLQVWFPSADSEANYYSNKKIHGATLSNVSIDKETTFFIDEIIKECEASRDLHDLSAIVHGFGPIILIASRHYRLPVPFHFFTESVK